LSKASLSEINPYMPNLSVTWMFQRAMSARPLPEVGNLKSVGRSVGRSVSQALVGSFLSSCIVTLLDSLDDTHTHVKLDVQSAHIISQQQQKQRQRLNHNTITPNQNRPSRPPTL
jgi:hypothetical protein